MLNHARTLLLNRPATDFDASMPGFVIVPAAFRPVQLKNSARLFHDAIFRRSQDPIFLLHRTARLLSILHGSRAEQTLDSLDSRRTYADDESTFWNAPEGTTVRQLVENGSALTVFGESWNAAVEGTAERRWNVRVLSPTEVEVQLLRSSRPSVTTTVADEGNVSSAFPLFGSALQARISYPVSLLSGNAWEVVHRSWPMDGIAAMERDVLSIGEEALVDVLHVTAGAVEPWTSLRLLADRHPDASERLAALLASFILTVEEHR